MPPAPKKKKAREGESSDDDEYRKKRDRNNMAVKRSRVKSRMRTQETMERVDQLKRENDQLEEKIRLLSKELGFLKELFIAHASASGLPQNLDIDQLFADNEPISESNPDFFKSED